MMEHGPGRIKRKRPFLFSDFEHLAFWYKQKFRIRIDESRNQPGQATRSTCTCERVIHFMVDLFSVAHRLRPAAKVA